MLSAQGASRATHFESEDDYRTGCLCRLRKMTHISQGNSVAGECHFGFPSRYVGVLFAYF